MNPAAATERARQERRANKKFFARLRARPPRDLDERFHRNHAEVFAETDCLECANCCRTTSPIFRDVDIGRLARHLGLRPAELVQRHLHLDAEGDYVLNAAPCPFLGADNYCSVYAARPRACRDYPHTDRKNMLQILPLTLRNTLVCPAVGEIVRRLRTAGAVVLLLLIFGSCLRAGPWPQPRGNGYFKLYEWWLRFDEHYTGSGERDPNATLGLYNTVAYAEYGLSDRLTAVGNLTLYSRATIAAQISGTRGNVLAEGEATGGLGDSELGLRYAITRPGAPWALAAGLYLGLPLGNPAGGREGNLQTGDGEFNQLLQLELGRSFGAAYASALVGVNNRTEGFSDELRLGLEAGLGLSGRRLWLIARLRASESFRNGLTAAERPTTSVFSNNAEYLSLGAEINYFFADRWGVSGGVAGAVSGKIIAAAPVYSLGVFYAMNR